MGASQARVLLRRGEAVVDGDSEPAVADLHGVLADGRATD
jgi:hypothetical protein